MRVVLLNPPLDTPGALSRQYRYEHLGLGYLASALRQVGVETAIVDAVLQDFNINQAIDAVLSHDPAVVGLSVFLTARDSTKKIIEGLHQKTPHIHTVAGGHYPTFNYKSMLLGRGAPTSVVRGEGEHTTVELLNHLRAGTDWRSTKGIAYVESDQVIETGMRPLISQLDSLPFPARDLFDRTRTAGRLTGLSFSSSRGCGYSCGYCSISSFYRLSDGPKWRARSAENIVEEILEVAGSHDFDYVHFHDDRFIGPGQRGRRRAKALAREMIDRSANIPFVILSRPDDVDYETFSRLRSAGLTRVELGVESGVQSTLDFFGKRMKLEAVENAVDICRRLDIDLLFFFIMFHPYSTVADLKANFEFMNRIGPEHFSMPFVSLEFLSGTPHHATVPAGDQRKPSEPGYCCVDESAEQLQKAILFASRRLDDLLRELYSELGMRGAALYDGFDAAAKAFQVHLFGDLLDLVETVEDSDLEKHAASAVSEFSSHFEQIKPRLYSKQAAQTQVSQLETG